MKMFKPDSPFSLFMGRVADIMILNILFLVFSLGIVTIGASYTALYCCTLKIKDDECVSAPKMFISSFKSNFRQSIVLFLILLIPLSLLFVEIMLAQKAAGNSTLVAVCASLSVFLIGGATSFVFPLQACFENSIGLTLKHSVLLSVSHFPTTLLLLLINFVFPELLFFPELFLSTLFFWFFFGFSLLAKIKVKLLRPIFAKLCDYGV